MPDTDDFSDILDEAMQGTEEEVPNVLDDEGGDVDEQAPQAAKADTDHGGDIDDGEDHGGNRLNLDQARAQKLQQADTLLSQWQAEKDRREQAYQAAQAEYRKARKAVMDDGGDEEQEFKAQEALMDARMALDKANDGYNQAAGWHRQVQNEPELSAAQKAWVESNPRYVDDAKFQQRANRIMAKLREEGYDDTRAPFFERVNKALREQPRMGQDRRPASGAPVIRTSKTESAKQGGRISDGEKRFIQRLGFNPNDKRVQEQYLASRNNTRAVAGKRGAL